MPLEVGNQTDVWRGYRALRRAWTGLWIGIIPFALFFMVVLDPEGRAFQALILAYMLAFGFVTVRFTSWRCPRCGKPFVYGRWKVSSPLDLLPDRPCKHCGLVEGNDRWEEE